MTTWGMVKSFDVDNGELDGLTPSQCFVLGYELAQIDAAVKAGEAISTPVHALNRERIAKTFDLAGRGYSLTWLQGDASESWMQLESGGRA